MHLLSELILRENYNGVAQFLHLFPSQSVLGSEYICGMIHCMIGYLDYFKNDVHFHSIAPLPSGSSRNNLEILSYNINESYGICILNLKPSALKKGVETGPHHNFHAISAQTKGAR